MRVSRHRAIEAACVLALVALALMCWSVLDPRPVPVILAMSLGQGIGTLSFATLVWVVIADLRKAQRLAATRIAQAGTMSERPPRASK